MRKLILVLALSLLSATAASADCSPGGTCWSGIIFNCNLWYNHLENWNFDSSCDWSYQGATRATDGQMCGGTFYSPGYAQMWWRNVPRYSRVYQVVYIPTQGQSGWFSNSTTWSVGYNLQFDDPLLEAANTFRVRIYDNDTNTLIASGNLHRGSQGDPWCTQYGFNFTANLNGKNVRFELYSQWSLNEMGGEAIVNVDNVSLAQYYQ